MRNTLSSVIVVVFLCVGVVTGRLAAQELLQAQPPTRILINNARIYDGKGDALLTARNILIEGNAIARISTDPIDPGPEATVLDANGRTLMPGLIDMHTHLMFSTLPQTTLLTADLAFTAIAASKAAEDTLMRGFTSVRDMGGPVFGLKRAIDMRLVPGPRIWPSGAMISQTGGHGDFRLPTEMPAAPGQFTYSERVGAVAVADSPDTVRQRVREQLALGASQIKLMAGGGISSFYDPIDVTQYTVEEMRAAVEAAENWGTYVAVHAYTPRAVRMAIEAGVKCIDHGQLLDESTIQLMAERGVWLSIQPFIDSKPSAYAEGSPSRLKQLEVFRGTENAIAWAKKHNVKLAWGTDALFNPAMAARQGTELVVMTRWFTPAQVLRMATSGNAELLALSGNRSPYPGKLGAVEEGALADLLIVNGDPLSDIRLMEDAAKNIPVIIKDGRIYKNALQP
jgi:imidazolonepropionase-like amidohydrolase